MKKVLLAAALLTFASAPALAKPTQIKRTKVVSKKAKTRYERVQRMVFRGSEVNAGVQRPDGTGILERPPARMGTMNLVRATFLRELVKSGEDI
ncbi:MAG: hypothetical protein KC503_17585 [Myxococcales bacterium]|nr:hypothetical protein [Myxococcales bacterium]